MRRVSQSTGKNATGSTSQVPRLRQNIAQSRHGSVNAWAQTIHQREGERTAVQANMQLHLKSHAAFTEDSSRKGASRAFAAASATKKSRASVDQRPPTSAASTTKVALFPSLRALGKCAPYVAEQMQAPPRWSCQYFFDPRLQGHWPLFQVVCHPKHDASHKQWQIHASAFINHWTNFTLAFARFTTGVPGPVCCRLGRTPLPLVDKSQPSLSPWLLYSIVLAHLAKSEG